MLLFRAGGAERMAVPLGLVARLEDIPRDKIETVRRRAGHAVSRQADAAGRAVAAAIDPASAHQPVLVFADGDRTHGPDGRRDHRRGRGPAGHRTGRRAARACSAPR